MKILHVFSLVLVWVTSLICTAPAQAKGYKTMHFGNDLPRPDGVVISGARPDQVVLYCTTVSAGCKGLREHLNKIGLDFLDKDPQTDPVAAAEFEALGGQGVPFVVFKHRLMHSYYPTAFDKLHAQYHTGVEPAPTSMAPSVQTARPLPAEPAAARAPSSHVDTVKPEAIAAYIQTHPDVVVQFTSPDDRCRYCVETYQGFDAAALNFGRQIKFARVEWSPWNQFPKEISALYRGVGVPVQIAYRAGNETAQFQGSLMNRNREFGAYIKQSFALGDAPPGSAIMVDEVLPENLAGYLARYPRTVVHFTSPDPNCQPCARSYASFDEVAAGKPGSVRFARVQWMPWRIFPDALENGQKPRVLPAILAFKDGTSADALAGTPGKAQLQKWIDRHYGAGQ